MMNESSCEIDIKLSCFCCGEEKCLINDSIMYQCQNCIYNNIDDENPAKDKYLLQKFKDIMEEKIESLKDSISGQYYEFENEQEKETFLNGKERGYIDCIWDICDFFGEEGIKCFENITNNYQKNKSEKSPNESG